jgi:polyisoprenoid-binding protein YceI
MARRLGVIVLVTALLSMALLPLPGAAEPRRWVPLTPKSNVGLDGTHVFGDFSGWADVLAGEFAADTADLRKGVTGWVTVSPKALTTGDAGRDRQMRAALEVDRFPEIRFTLERVEASFASVGERADVLLKIHGTLAIHGVERPTSFYGRARLKDDAVWVRGETTLKLTEFGISPPTRFLLAVRDTIQVRFDLTLRAAN